MLNQECKVCGNKFHYCGSCSPDWAMEMGYCSEECFYTEPHVKEFEEWFNWLVALQPKQFHKIVLTEAKEDLMINWMIEVRE